LALVPALGAERAPLGLGEADLEARAGERERVELRGQRAGQIPRHPPPLDREPARPLGGGAPGRLGGGLALHHRLAPALDAVELGRQLPAPAEQVLARADQLSLPARSPGPPHSAARASAATSPAASTAAPSPSPVTRAARARSSAGARSISARSLAASASACAAVISSRAATRRPWRARISSSVRPRPL